jgi:hypothetical protein
MRFYVAGQVLIGWNWGKWAKINGFFNTCWRRGCGRCEAGKKPQNKQPPLACFFFRNFPIFAHSDKIIFRNTGFVNLLRKILCGNKIQSLKVIGVIFMGSQ